MRRKTTKMPGPGVSDPALFEVQCRRCDVTFAAGTKRCLHCSGKTSPSSAARTYSQGLDVGVGSASAAEIESAYGTIEAPPNASPASASGPSLSGGTSFDGSSFDEHAFGGEDEFDDDFGDGFGETLGEASPRESEPAQGPLKSILGSMGSLIWVAMLIAFSMTSRTCGE